MATSAAVPIANSRIRKACCGRWGTRALKDMDGVEGCGRNNRLDRRVGLGGECWVTGVGEMVESKLSGNDEAHLTHRLETSARRKEEPGDAHDTHEHDDVKNDGGSTRTGEHAVPPPQVWVRV